MLGHRGRHGRKLLGHAGLHQHVAVDEHIRDRPVLSRLLDELLEGFGAGLRERGGARELHQFGQPLRHVLGLLGLALLAGRAAHRSVDARDDRGLPSRAHDRGDQGLRRGTRALGQVVTEGLARVGVDRGPLVQILQDGGDLLAGDLGGDLVGQHARQRGAGLEVAQQLRNRDQLGGVLDQALRGAEGERGADTQASVARLAVLGARDGQRHAGQRRTLAARGEQ